MKPLPQDRTNSPFPSNGNTVTNVAGLCIWSRDREGGGRSHAVCFVSDRRLQPPKTEGSRIHGIKGRGAQRIELARGALEALGIPAGEDQLGPFSASSSGRFEPDAGATADHDDGLSEEFRFALDGRGDMRRPSGSAGFLPRKLYRSDLNPARTSSEKSFGCSQAAKCPPFSTLL